MRQVKLHSNKNRYTFSISPTKYFVGDNYQLKHELKSIIKHKFDYRVDSEYSINEKTYYSAYVDDKELDKRKDLFYVINEDFDLDYDLGLKRNSVVLKHLEQQMSEIEVDERVVTINHLISELNDDLVEKHETSHGYQLYPQIEPFNFKSIVKQLEVYLVKEEMRINQQDLVYEEIIIYQLELIRQIAINDQLKDYYVLCEIPLLTTSIVNTLEAQETNNLYFLVFTELSNSVMNYSNTISLNRQMIDFANEIELYNELVLEYPAHITMEELKNTINNYLSGQESTEIERLKTLL